MRPALDELRRKRLAEEAEAIAADEAEAKARARSGRKT